MIRTFWTYLVSGVTTFVLSITAIVAGLIGHRGTYYDWVAHAWARCIVWPSGVRITVEGAENIRLDQPQIIVSNHQSWFDVFALAAIIPKRFRFVAKEELRAIPLWGKAWESAGHISINRKDRVKAITALEAAGAVVRRDNSAIVIFPEGTRSRTGQLQPFKKGTFLLAVSTALDIVPTAVIGSRGVQKKNDWRVHAGPVIVRFGEPIDTSGFSEENIEQLMNIVHERVAALLDHPERKRDL